MTFDLGKLDTTTACEVTHELELRHPVTNEPLGMFIEHRGADSAEVLAITRRQTNELLKRSFVAQRKGKEDEAETVESLTDRGTRVLVAATVAWFERDAKGKRIEGFGFGEGRMTFTPENAADLYSRPGFVWLRRQLDDAVGDLGNFIKT